MSTPTTDTQTVRLISLKPGDKFTYGGVEYMLIQYGRGTKEHIARVSDRTPMQLARTAYVLPAGRDEKLFGEILNAVTPQLRPGTTVRIVTNARTTKAGIAGVESVITRANDKTYTLANGYRISPSWVEEV